MNLIDTGKLIAEVRDHPYLYNISLPQYKDSALKEETWSKIADKFCVDKYLVKNRWKCLRDNFSREARKRRQNGRLYGRVSHWPFYDDMKFLAGNLIPRKYRWGDHSRSSVLYSRGIAGIDANTTIMNIQLTSSDNDHCAQNFAINEIKQIQSCPTTSAAAVYQQYSINNSFARDTNIKIEPDVIEAQCDKDNIILSSHSLDQADDDNTIHSAVEHSPDKDQPNEIDAFGVFVVAELKTMTPYQQGLAKLKIQKALFDVRFN